MPRHTWKPINWDNPAPEGGRTDAFAPPALPVASATPQSGPVEPLRPGPGEAPPSQQLSPWRLLAALVLVAGAALGVLAGVRHTIASRAAAGLSATWFAPYVDATLTPTYQFQDVSSQPARQVVLGFVVAAPHQGCVPSWGGYYGLDAASQALSLDGRLAQLRQEGVGAVVSFGGRSNTELAEACTSAPALATAYGNVVERYRLTTVDFDIEGSGLTDWRAVERRAVALHLLQSAAAAHHHQLAVWLTLPVTPSGLAPDALSVLQRTLEAHVRLAGVNVMAMDYGQPMPDMGAAARSALSGTEQQLAQLYPRYGIRLSSARVWHSLGVTVMIGQNDTPGEVFTSSDASSLEAFAKQQHLGRVSIWSINRDRQCGSDYGLNGVLSNSCSGTSQATLQFDSIFSRLSGDAAAIAGQALPFAASGGQVNPADAPYPIWQPNVPYVTGYKVVWLGSIYQSKWYNQGQDPATDVQYAWQTPWTLIGPVLPGEHAPPTTTLPSGTYPAWSPTASYRAGARVLFSGQPYQAKWYNQADSPAAEAANPSGSPWLPLFSIPGEPTGTTGG